MNFSFVFLHHKVLSLRDEPVEHEPLGTSELQDY